jgi:phosphopantetheinyl transferase
MAKGLLANALGGAPESFEFLSSEAGPPFVLRGGKPLGGGGVSISHTASYVGVAFAPFAVGLDICDKADAARIARIAQRAFSEDEVALCRKTPEHFAALWALKEATLKMQGGGVFRPGLSSVRVQYLFPPALAFPGADVSLYALPLAYVCIASPSLSPSPSPLPPQTPGCR